MKELITIELFGQKYTFQAESGVSNARKVADLLASEVTTVENNIAKNGSGMNKITILTLAALNISSDYVELKRKYDELLQHIAARSASLVKMIDSNFK